MSHPAASGSSPSPPPAATHEAAPAAAAEPPAKPTTPYNAKEYTATPPSRGRLTSSVKIANNEEILVPDHLLGGTKIPTITVGLGWDAPKDVDLDAHVLLIDRNANVLEEINFENLESKNGAVVHQGDNTTGDADGDDEQVDMRLADIDEDVHAMLFVVNSFSGETFADVDKCTMRLLVAARHAVQEEEKKEPKEGEDGAAEKDGEGEGEEDDKSDAPSQDSDRKHRGGSSGRKPPSRATKEEESSATDQDGLSTVMEENEKAPSPEPQRKGEEGAGVGVPGIDAAKAAEESDDETALPITARDMSGDTEISRFDVECIGDNTTLVVGVLYRQADGSGWTFKASGVPATGDSIEEMLPQLLQALRFLIPSIPEVTDAELPAAAQPHALEPAAVSSALSLLGKTADGAGIAYRRATVTGGLYTDVAALAPFKDLQHVILNGNKIADLSALGAIPNLLSVSATENRIVNWATLPPREYLEELNLAKNYVASLGAQPHPRLRKLTLHNNHVTALPGLDSLTALSVLEMRGNKMASLRHVASPSLTELYLDENRIRLLGAPVMPNLTRLHLRGNKIVKTKGMETLVSLTYLNLRNNLIANINEVKRLVPLVKLQTLSLLDNPIQDELAHNYRVEVLVHLPGLTRLDKDVVLRDERLDADELRADQLEQAAAEAARQREEGGQEEESETVSNY